MQESLRELLAGPTLRRTHVGLRVESLRSGKLFFGRRVDALMDPASNQKILATTTALLRLGSNWRFRTEVSGPLPDDDGVVHGDLHVRGNGDPTLRTADLEQLAAHLVDQGVTVVEGGISRGRAAPGRRQRRRRRRGRR